MNLLKADHVTLRFGGVTAVNDVSFTVGAGETVALIGPNGAGKSSLFNCISALYQPQVGSIKFDGVELTRFSPDRIAKLGIARTFQNIELFGGLTVMENLLLGRHRHVKANLWTHFSARPLGCETKSSN